MTSETKAFEGWVALGPDAAQGNLVWKTFEPKPFGDDDVEIEITHCSIDGSDIHILRSGWGPTDYPIVAGREIVGKAVRIGKNVVGIKVGNRVGLGAQSGSCLRSDCIACSSESEQHCPEMIHTYSNQPDSKYKTYGGFATRWRGDGRFVFKIPDSMPSQEAAPLFCGGITVYAPLKQHNVGPGKRVGIIGVGGLGHLGLLFAKALGADHVVAISRTNAKKDDAIKLGADDFIATEEPGWEDRCQDTLDVIINTVSSSDMPFPGYLNMLRFGGTLVQIGGPEQPLPSIYATTLVLKRLTLAGSFLGGRKEIQDLLNFAADKQIHPWISERPMQDANQALIDFQAGEPRYRIVLSN